MKHRFCLLLPLILISACNGSDSKPDDSVARSTFDAVTAELDSAKRERDTLARKNAELATENAAIAADKTQIQASLDAKLSEISSTQSMLEQTRTELASASSSRDVLQTRYDTVVAAYTEALDASAECTKKFETALKIGKISEDEKVTLSKFCDDAKANLASLKQERDTAKSDLDVANTKVTDLTNRVSELARQLADMTGDRDKLNETLLKLAQNVCQ